MPHWRLAMGFSCIANKKFSSLAHHAVFSLASMWETKQSFLKKMLLICALPVIVASLTLDKCSTARTAHKSSERSCQSTPPLLLFLYPPADSLSVGGNYLLIGRARQGIREDPFCCLLLWLKFLTPHSWSLSHPHSAALWPACLKLPVYFDFCLAHFSLHFLLAMWAKRKWWNQESRLAFQREGNLPQGFCVAPVLIYFLFFSIFLEKQHICSFSNCISWNHFGGGGSND